MSSARLTKEMRKQIVKNAIEATAKHRIDAARTVMHAVGKEVYDYVIGDLTPHFEALRAHLPVDQAFRVLYKNKELEISLTDYYPVWARNYGGKHAPRQPTAELCQKYLAAEKAHTEARDESLVLAKEIRAVLDSVSTVNRLLEVWPEGKQYISEGMFAGQTRNLPAVIVDGLNQKLRTYLPAEA